MINTTLKIANFALMPSATSLPTQGLEANIASSNGEEKPAAVVDALQEMEEEEGLPNISMLPSMTSGLLNLPPVVPVLIHQPKPKQLDLAGKLQEMEKELSAR